jgi:hypothetical protein
MGRKIPARDQAESAGVDYHLKDLVRDWEKDPRGYRTTYGVYMTWMQDGWKNRGRSVENVRMTLDPVERGATIYDGIGLYIARPNILTEHSVSLPGTSVKLNSAAYLRLLDGRRPQMSDTFTKFTNPMFGSATCGRDNS